MKMAVFYRLKEQLHGRTVALGIVLSGAGIALLIWDVPGLPTGNDLALGGVLLGSGITLILVELASVAQLARAKELERELAELSFPAFRSAAQLATSILSYWNSGSTDAPLRMRCLQLGESLAVAQVTETTIASGSNPPTGSPATSPDSAVRVADQRLNPIAKALGLRPPAGTDIAFRAGAALELYFELVDRKVGASSDFDERQISDLADRIVELLRIAHQPDDELIRVDSTLRDVDARLARREGTDLYLRLLRWHLSELGNPAPVFSKLGWMLSEGPPVDDPAFTALAESMLASLDNFYPEGHA